MVNIEHGNWGLLSFPSLQQEIWVGHFHYCHIILLLSENVYSLYVRINEQMVSSSFLNIVYFPFPSLSYFELIDSMKLRNTLSVLPQDTMNRMEIWVALWYLYTVTMYLTPLSAALYSLQDVIHLGLDVPKYKSYFCHFLSIELGWNLFLQIPI